jgi:hypothetical protein
MGLAVRVEQLLADVDTSVVYEHIRRPVLEPPLPQTAGDLVDPRGLGRANVGASATPGRA